MKKKIKINGNKLARKILAGERDFRGIVLENPKKFPYMGIFPELMKYTHFPGRFSKEGIDFSGSDLNYSNFSLLCLDHLTAENSDFNHSYFYSTSLDYANLRNANLTGAIMWGTSINHTNLQGCNLSHAQLIGAQLEASDLREVKFLHTIMTSANLRLSNLRGANLHGASYRGANFDSADLRNSGIDDYWGDVVPTRHGLCYVHPNPSTLEANYLNTKVTHRQKEVLEKALDRARAERFVLKDDEGEAQ
jgi:uncharacterized protein YjbI with pentapeptide repeats